MRTYYNNSGFVAFTTLLIISAVALAVSISVSLLGVGSARSSFDVRKGQETSQVARGCYEEAMLRLKRDDTYTGETGFAVGNGTCDILISGSGVDRTIEIVAQVSSVSLYIKKITAQVKIAPGSINIISYNQD